jgi:hypothetical protein
METARFTNKHVHLFKEQSDAHARTYCGLSERTEIWSDRNSDVTCQHCLRVLAETVNELSRKVDSLRIGPGGALYPS